MKLLAVPPVLGALAIGILVGFVNMGPEPQVGKITARTLVDGEMVARIEAPAPYETSGREVVVAELVLPVEYHTASTVPVRVLSTHALEIAEPGIRMPGTGLAVVVGLSGFLLGLVILNNSRGFGFVRGTGQVGEMQPVDVDEDRGFYWRS